MPKCTKIGPIRPLLLAKDTIPFLLLTVVQGFSTYITIIALGYILTEDQIGQFRVANQISEALNIILLGISVVIAPKITISHAQQNWGDLRYTLIHAHRAGIALLIVPVIMLTVWGAPILGIVFGQAYTPAYDAMQILLIGKLIYCLFGFSGLVLAVTGEASKATLATTFSTLFMMLLLYPLVAYFGITGAALAHAIGGILNAVFCAMLIPKKYKSMSAISSPKCR
jgi:O-antigen/teichoic acid export membrane protein